MYYYCYYCYCVIIIIIYIRVTYYTVYNIYVNKSNTAGCRRPNNKGKMASALFLGEA